MRTLKGYDVVVVGAGNAALCAALSALESGARVLVLENGRLGFDGDVDEGIKYLHYDSDDENNDDDELGADV